VYLRRTSFLPPLQGSSVNSPQYERHPNPFVAAWQGLRLAVGTERNLRFHLGFAAVVVFAGLWLQISRWEWGLLIVACAGVLVTELVNTAIEKMLDRLAPEWHLQTRAAKDVAAAAVLLAVVAAVLIGLIVFGPPLWRWLGLKA
jgi:diacylglycerol kinase